MEGMNGVLENPLNVPIHPADKVWAFIVGGLSDQRAGGRLRFPRTRVHNHPMRPVIVTMHVGWYNNLKILFVFVALNSYQMFWNVTVEIEADLEHPERNREVNVFLFSSKKHEGKLHDGV